MEEVVLDHDAGATAGHCAQRALVHVHFAADPAQRDPGAEATDRPAGHGDLERRTAPEHLLPPPVNTHRRKRCSAAEARSTDAAGRKLDRCAAPVMIDACNTPRWTACPSSSDQHFAWPAREPIVAASSPSAATSNPCAPSCRNGWPSPGGQATASSRSRGGRESEPRSGHRSGTPPRAATMSAFTRSLASAC